VTAGRAILIAVPLAGALIGAGLFFGLRAMAPPALPTPSAPLPVLTAADADRIAKEAAAALEKHRAWLTRNCLKGETRPARFVFNFTFDASGMQLARGLSEERGTAADGAGGCVNQSIPPLKLSPIGKTLSFEVPFQLP